MNEGMLALFEEAQLSKRSHKGLAKKMASQYLNENEEGEEFFKIFLHCIVDQTLLHPKSTADIQRIIAFCALCVVGMPDSLKVSVFAHLFKRLKSTVKHVRQRVSQMIENFLGFVSQSSIEMDCALLQDISNHLIIRLADKVPAVRSAAVQALSHLQDPDNKKDPVILAFLDLLQAENIANVRSAVLKTLPWCELTVQPFIQHLRDVSHEVRLCVVNRFVEDTDIRQFSRSERNDIAHAILQDRNNSVRTAGEKVLLNWLTLLNNDVAKFLTFFGPVENEKVVMLVAFWLAEKVFTNGSNSFGDIGFSSMNWKGGLGDLSPAELLWTVARCQYREQYTSKFAASQLFQAILPPVDFMRQVIREINVSLLNQNRLLQFNLRNFLCLIPLYDAVAVQSEESLANSQINAELSHLLLDHDIDYELYRSILDYVWKIDSVRQNAVVENVLKDYWDKLQANSEEEEEERDLITGHILLLINSILKHKTYDAFAMSKCFEFVLNCLQQPNAELRAFATASVAVFCLFDEDIRQKYIRVLKQVAVGEFEDERVQMEAMKGLTDVCLCVMTEFSSEDKAEIDGSLLRQMQKTVDNNYDEVSLLSMESALKLVFNGFSKDPALVSKFLQFFFIDANDISASSPTNIIRMNQLLSLFLHSFLLNEENCFEIVRKSLPLFISDCVISMKDERLDADCLGKIMENLFGICREVLLTVNSSGRENGALVDSYFLLSKTAFACLCSELLKLGQDESDKIMFRDFVKQLHNLGASWCSSAEVTSVLAVIKAVRASTANDKISEKTLLKLEELVLECRESTVTAALSIMDCAPALRELVHITSDYWEEDSSVVGKKRTRTTKPRPQKVVEESSESEEEEVDSDDYSGEEEEDEE